MEKTSLALTSRELLSSFLFFTIGRSGSRLLKKTAHGGEDEY